MVWGGANRKTPGLICPPPRGIEPQLVEAQENTAPGLEDAVRHIHGGGWLGCGMRSVEIAEFEVNQPGGFTSLRPVDTYWYQWGILVREGFQGGRLVEPKANRVCVTRRKLQTPGNAEEYKRQETPTINPIGPTDKPHRPSTKHYRKDSLGDA